MRLSPFILVSAALLAACSQERGQFEQVVVTPRDQLYAELDAQVSALEQAVAAKPTKTGNPPVSVRFAFEHDQDRHLRIAAVAGFRTVIMELWLEDGDAPGETRLSVTTSGMSDVEGITADNVRFPVQDRLTKAVAQANEGVRIAALFGKG
jgi:hypothetical protein